MDFREGLKLLLSMDTLLWNDDINQPLLLRSHPEAKPKQSHKFGDADRKIFRRPPNRNLMFSIP